RNSLLATRDLRAVDADVEASLSPLAHEGDVPAERFQLSVGCRVAHAEKVRRLVARDLAARQQRGDQPGGPFEGAEASQVLSRHDPERIISSAEDHNWQTAGSPRLHRHSTP